MTARPNAKAELLIAYIRKQAVFRCEHNLPRQVFTVSFHRDESRHCKAIVKFPSEKANPVSQETMTIVSKTTEAVLKEPCRGGSNFEQYKTTRNHSRLFKTTASSK